MWPKPKQRKARTFQSQKRKEIFFARDTPHKKSVDFNKKIMVHYGKIKKKK